MLRFPSISSTIDGDRMSCRRALHPPYTDLMMASLLLHLAVSGIGVAQLLIYAPIHGQWRVSPRRGRARVAQSTIVVPVK